jgi:hypothetical protein
MSVNEVMCFPQMKFITETVWPVWPFKVALEKSSVDCPQSFVIRKINCTAHSVLSKPLTWDCKGYCAMKRPCPSRGICLGGWAVGRMKTVL